MSESREVDPQTLKSVIHLIHKHTGITMGENKKSLIQGRLRTRIRQLGIADFRAYVSYLETTKDESQHFVNLVTTNETSFFRTKRVWDYFIGDLLPAWNA